MLEEFFDSNGADYVGELAIQLYNVTLKKRFADLEMGSKYDWIILDFNNGTWQVGYGDNTQEGKFTLIGV